MLAQLIIKGDFVNTNHILPRRRYISICRLGRLEMDYCFPDLFICVCLLGEGCNEKVTYSVQCFNSNIS